MQKSEHIDRWFAKFPVLSTLAPEHRTTLQSRVSFAELAAGDVAYREGGECANYLMCVDGGTRAFKMSSSGRELLLYRVVPGTTCVFTTQCLLAGGTFPAESVSEAATRMAAIPAATFHDLMGASPDFRRFVLDDYSQLLTSMISLVDQVAFSSLDQRLAQRLLLEADALGVVSKTHQQIAGDIGSVREVVSRHLAEWERAGWVKTARGSIQIVDRAALEGYRTSKGS